MNVGQFEFNGISSTSFGLVSSSVNRPIFPEMRPRLLEIYGKNGTIDFGSNTYDTRKITMRIAYIGTDYLDLRTRAREISNWLKTTTWARLRINDEPDKYYLARVYGQIDFETLQRLGECEISFECQPFALHLISTGEEVTWNNADFFWIIDAPMGLSEAYTVTATQQTTIQFDNPGTMNVGQDAPQGGKFDIIITGSWRTLLLSLNGKTIEYVDDDSGTLIIDSVDMEVTLDGVNKLSSIDGDIDSFLNVISGTNQLTIDGTYLNVEVVIDFIPMWI